MPAGFEVDKLARAIVGLAFVVAAYMAEAVRGGLQALPEGQAEAAQALGLGYWRIQRMIVLPQALWIALADPNWVGMNMEAYVFAGAIYWFACFGMSQWSRLREQRLQVAHGR